MTALPNVDLPEPDSPTIPSVSPRRTCTSRPFTALNTLVGLPKKFFFSANSTRTSFASISTSGLPLTGSRVPRGMELISSMVYSCFGSANTLAILPRSTISPWRITQTVRE